MKKQAVLAVFLVALVLAVTVGAVSAVVSVGVKEGDWIEYKVTTTGSPPADHDVQWARMEVTGVQGTAFDVEVTTQFSNGSFLHEVLTLNLEKGQIGDSFFIPANLDKGDVFFDANVGTITIINVEQKTYANAERTVVSASTPQTTFFWDRETGAMMEAYSTYPEYNFAITTVVDKTNMWQPQISGLEAVGLYALTIAAVAVVVGIGVVLVLRRKRSS
ncbi:MAG: hypothetical protein NWF00_12605 [Candidatus Bathyarchaeota archaeon]|nr:hypothetical protein [Candidatus Bathyarchaeota archaeon]